MGSHFCVGPTLDVGRLAFQEPAGARKRSDVVLLEAPLDKATVSVASISSGIVRKRQEVPVSELAPYRDDERSHHAPVPQAKVLPRFEADDWKILAGRSGKYESLDDRVQAMVVAEPLYRRL